MKRIILSFLLGVTTLMMLPRIMEAHYNPSFGQEASNSGAVVQTFQTNGNVKLHKDNVPHRKSPL